MLRNNNRVEIADITPPKKKKEETGVVSPTPVSQPAQPQSKVQTPVPTTATPKAPTPTQSESRLAELEKSMPSYTPSSDLGALREALQQLEAGRPGEYTPSAEVTRLLESLRQTEAGRPGEYAPSDIVNDALAQLLGKEGNKPTYTNNYEDRINALLEDILGRKEFSYDFNADPMYQMYAQKYREQGRQAMMDTMGQAAGLTGGYGNSYAQMAGQQAYQQNLANLNDVIPQLRDAAYQMYRDQGSDMRNNMQLLRDLESTEYGRHRDDVSDYYTDLDYFFNKYHALSAEDYQKYKDNINLWMQDRDHLYDRYSTESARDYGRYQDALDQYNRDRDYATDRLDTETDRDYNRYRDTVGDWRAERDYWNDKSIYEAAQAAAEANAKSGGGGGGGSSKKAASAPDYSNIAKNAQTIANEQGMDAAINYLMRNEQYLNEGDAEKIYNQLIPPKQQQEAKTAPQTYVNPDTGLQEKYVKKRTIKDILTKN